MTSAAIKIIEKIPRSIYINNYIMTRNLSKINYFDVTLRDGLQSIKTCYSLSSKKEILDEIIKKRNPSFIEVGSIVSPKILPQMNDSIELYKYAKYKYKNNHEFYMLVPNLKSLNIALKNKVENISLITSISESFQKKNTSKTLPESKNEIKQMIEYNDINKIKLYISCIDTCPIEGKQSIGKIIDEVLYYNTLNNINELCLSDTCGELNYLNFVKIIDQLLLYIPSTKISLHLHVSENNYENVYNIIRYAFNKCIYKYDVSYYKNLGGCSVTIDSKLNGNLTYNMLESCLV